MTIIYIIVGIVLVIFIYNYFKSKSERNSVFLKIRKRLEEDLLHSEFSGDWKKRQEINLQLIWIKVVIEVEKGDISHEINQEIENLILSKLSLDDIKFPKRWVLDDLYCYPFAQEIIAAFGKILAENEYKGKYIPDFILPVPKVIIRKAILFTFDYLNLKESIYIIDDKDKIADAIATASVILNSSFIDTGNDDIPKESMENFRMGKMYEKKQPEYNQIDDLKLIDWRSEIDWIVYGVQLIDKTNDYKWIDNMPELINLKENFQYSAKISDYEWAIACFERANELYPNSNDIKVITGITYLSMAEFYKQNGDEKNNITYMKKSAELGNK